METQPTPPEVAPTGHGRRRRRARFFKISAALMVVVLAALMAVPMVLSAEFMRSKVERAMADALGTDVRLAGYDISWFSGFTVDGFEVSNPEGFPRDNKALVLQSARGDFSFWSLLRGRIDIEAAVEGLEIRVVQKADGRSNFGELFGVEVRSEEIPEPPSLPDPEEGHDFGNLRIDLQLVDGRIDLEHEQHGVLESLRNLDASMRKEFGGSDFGIEVTTELHRPGVETAGKLGLEVDVDLSFERPVKASLSVVGLDLERYRPLLSSFVPAQDVLAFAGVVGGSTQASVDLGGSSIEVEGNLNIERPHFAGPLFLDMDIRSEHWVLSPNLTLTLHQDGTPPVVDADGLRLDLGFLKVTGLPADEASSLLGGQPSVGIGFEVDLGRVAAMGGPIPEQLRGAVGNARGRAALEVVPELMHPEELSERWLEVLSTKVEAQVERFDIEGHQLGGLRAELTAGDGAVHLATRATLGGGPVTLDLDLDPKQPESWPCELELAWKEATVRAPSVAVLRYALPVFAGVGTAADLQSGIGLELKVSGPLAAGNYKSVLDWLNHWSGRGSLQLQNGAFTPGASLQPLFQVAGKSGRLAFDEIRTEFTFADGYVQTELLRLDNNLGRLGITGRTKLSGEIDYLIDLAEEMAQHRSGKKWLERLGGKIPKAVLSGTVDKPELELPDFASQFLKQSADDLLRRGLEDLLRRKKKR